MWCALRAGCVLAAFSGLCLAESTVDQIEDLCREGRYDQAEALAHKALATHRRRNPHGHDCAATLHNLAVVYVGRGRTSEAVPLYRRALTIDTATGKSTSPETATTLTNLATLRREQGHLDEAKDLLHRALPLREDAHGEDHHWTAAVLTNLAMIHERLGQKAEATEAQERAMTVFQNSLATSSSPLTPPPVFRRDTSDAGLSETDAADEPLPQRDTPDDAKEATP